MRQRRRAKGLRELRIVIPDARDPVFRRKVADEVARLEPGLEADATRWIESVSRFGEGDASR
jgi:hypothetical protein